MFSCLAEASRPDTGTMDSLVDAADFVRMIEKRQSIKISAPEEIAYKNEWISKDKLLESAERYGKSPHGQHLKAVAKERCVTDMMKRIDTKLPGVYIVEPQVL